MNEMIDLQVLMGVQILNYNLLYLYQFDSCVIESYFYIFGFEFFQVDSVVTLDNCNSHSVRISFCFVLFFIGLSLHVTEISHVDWSKSLNGNCHGFNVLFSTDFDLNKTDSISVLWINKGENKSFPCKVMIDRHGVCSISLSSSQEKTLTLFFYLKHMDKVRFSMNNKSFSYLTATPERSRLLKKYRYILRYEGEIIKFGNLIWKEYDRVFKF